MTLHNYFVTVGGREQGIFRGFDAPGALDDFARSLYRRSWDDLERYTGGAGDFKVTRIEDTVIVKDRTPEAARELRRRLDLVGSFMGVKLYYLELARLDGFTSHFSGP